MSIERYRQLLDRAESSPDYWREAAIIEFTESLCRLMEEKKISKAELARRMGTSRAYITRLLGGDANFTLGTMVKLALAVDGSLEVRIADKGVVSRWEDAPAAAPPREREEPEEPKVRKRRGRGAE
ncbi:MAG TPA: helix-turn-helix transcriptional regulator [Thermoanaerobaculia bacterium]|nr:helix-turn-helix transcriptional regulator [Thermoanaerobaculia bacterium]